MNIVPSWGGSMFEALMVPLLVPEEEWAPRSWGVNHPLYVARADRARAWRRREYGFWGFSPSNNPAGGYREYGVDPIGLNPDGYTSDEERTPSTTASTAAGRAQPQPPSAQGVVTPHASFLALAARARRRSRTSRSSKSTSRPRTAPAASTTRSTSRRARSRATTSRSTRG